MEARAYEVIPFEVISGKKEKKPYVPVKDCTARPVKDREQLEVVKEKLLYSSKKYGYRNYAIFLLGINCGLRCGDVLQIRLKDIWDEGRKEITGLTVIEEKTKKTRRNIRFSETVREGLRDYVLTLKDRTPDMPLFPSQKKNVQKVKETVKDNTGCLAVKSYWRIMHEISLATGIEHLSTHSMRKTFGYEVYTKNAGRLIANEYRAIDVVQQMLNHNSVSDTLRYIGITEEVQNEVYEGMDL